METIILSASISALIILIWNGMTERKSINRVDRDFASLTLRCIDWTLKHKRKNFDYGYHMGKIYNGLWYLRNRKLVRFIPVSKKSIMKPRPDEVLLFKTNKGYWNMGVEAITFVIAMDKELFDKALDERSLEMTESLAEDIRNQCEYNYE